MRETTSRRALLRSLGGALAATAGIGAAGTASAETSQGAGSYWSEPRVMIDAVSYDGAERKGALLEDVVYDDPDAGLISDIHYVVHDGADAHDVRDDAATSEVGATAAQLEEVYLSTTLPVADGDAELYQQALVSETDNAPALLIDNELTLPAAGDYVVTTLPNPDLGDGDNEAYTVEDGHYQLLVATDGTYYAAFAQRESWRKQFDDQRVGVEGVASGEDKSAWRDAYVEGDGDLDTNASNDGDIDLAFELDASGYSELSWTTAIGFGFEEAAAVDRAVASLDSGFDAERQESYW
ncbi:hypothetical protein [Natronoarchaeum rubrum]|uniref:hypothetical protein n=1 Tax=Natronoarchaeum rubrum TaxID=755311 RepID=UPI002112D3C7|nr:hypothetical protein [Natronoarchaeum rubrum]